MRHQPGGRRQVQPDGIPGRHRRIDRQDAPSRRDDHPHHDRGLSRPIILTAAATKLNYYPEWIQTGLEINATGRLGDQDQMDNMVGLAGLEIPRASADTDWYRAYKEVDPDGPDPEEGGFRSLQQIANGIQAAGPKLTPRDLLGGSRRRSRTECPTRCGRSAAATAPTAWAPATTPTWTTSASSGGIAPAMDPTSSSAGAWQWVYKGTALVAGRGALGADSLVRQEPVVHVTATRRPGIGPG